MSKLKNKLDTIKNNFTIKKILTSGLFFCLFISVVGVSWSWFSPIGEQTSQVETNVTTANLSITYNGGNEFSAENILPGWTQTKTFTVENTGDSPAQYDINWGSLVNTFSSREDFVYSITSTETGGTLTETAVPASAGGIITNAIIGVGKTQEYTITFKYLNRSTNQISDQGKKISGKIIINEDNESFDTFYIKEDNDQSNALAYYTKDDMTWETWVGSALNYDGFTIDGSNIKNSGGYLVKDSAGTAIEKTATITKTGSYKMKPIPKTFAESIIASAPSETGTINSDGLMKVSQAATDQTKALTEYRYSGTSVNNYITFNNETWRIIGVFEVDNGFGTYETRVKIVKETSIGRVLWNTSSSNNWTTSTLKTHLNGTYYNNLSNDAKNQITDSKWYISSTGYSNTASVQYAAERKNTSYGDTNVLPISWTGKIALIYPSDYGYASSGCYTGTKTLYDYNNSDCSSSNWLTKNDSIYYFSLTPWSPSTLAVLSYSTRIDSHNVAWYAGESIPSTYLKTSVLLSDGTGTSEDPYIIEASTTLSYVKSLIYSNLNSSSVKLNWSSADNATYYKLERKKEDGSYTTLSDDLTDLEYSDSELDASTNYTYRVSACNSDGCNSTKKTVSITTAPAIGEIDTLSYSNLTQRTLTLSWDRATNATYYKVARKLTSASDYKTLSSNTTDLTYNIKGMTENTSYDFKITPCTKSSTDTEYCGAVKNLTVTTPEYTEKTPLIDELIGKAPNTTGTINSEGLMKVEQAATDQTSALTEYRYSGKTVNNYITFNNELWRIIGVFEVDDGLGTLETRVKIVKETSIGRVLWNTSSSSNNWTNASLNTYLNGTYYNSLSNDAKKQINTSKWYIASTGYSNTASVQYTAERANTSYGDTNVLPISWTGKIALIYPSDFGYASSGCYTGTKTLYDYNYGVCSDSNWLTKNDSIYYFALTPWSPSTLAVLSYSTRIDSHNVAWYAGESIPSTYLKSSVIVTGGDGSSDDPYTIAASTSLDYVKSLSYSNLNTSSVKLNWSSADNATYYKLERKTGDGNYSTISNNLTDLEYSDSNLSPSTSYTYRVASCNTDGCHDTKKTVSVTTSPALGEINTLSYTNLTQRTLTLNWTSSSNATYYKVERKPSSASDYTTLSSNITDLSYNIKGLTENTSYDFKITPCTKSSTDTEYCGTAKTLTVVTTEYTEKIVLFDEIESKSPSTTGTINSEGLMKVEQAATDQTTALTEYRYSGKSINNYITFNSEMWRIIGVFSVDNGSGTVERRVKIIKDSSLGRIVYDSNSTNNWTTASLNTYLNGDYYNSLSATAQGQIDTAKWYISATGESNTASAQYIAERAGTSSASGGNINWSGKIALMYPSDYGYASSGCYTGTQTLYNYNYSECTSTNWLTKGDSRYYFLLNPSSTNALAISNSSYVTTYNVRWYAGEAIPTTYLKSNIKVIGGDGSSTEPYVIQ